MSAKYGSRFENVNRLTTTICFRSVDRTYLHNQTTN